MEPGCSVSGLKYRVLHEREWPKHYPMSVRILVGDVREKLAELPDASVHCVVTSPPYFGLRDYGMAGQIGLEETPAAFVAAMVGVFREVRRVLRDDGTCWLNLGDSYAGSWGGQGHRVTDSDDASWHGSQIKNHPKRASGTGSIRQPGLKPKDLIGIPWRVAFALQADGWYLRQDIIWHKPNPMPESVTDRCTKAHEYLFLLSKSARYHYDAEAIAEPHGGTERPNFDGKSGILPKGSYEQKDRCGNSGDTRNRRSVWTVATQPFSEAHFATFPPDLIEPCIKAGCPKDCCAKCGAPHERQVERGPSHYELMGKLPGTTRNDSAPGSWGQTRTANGTVPSLRAASVKQLGCSPSCSCDAGLARGVCLDPFGGAGTTGLVADRLGRDAILIELNPAYAAMAQARIRADSTLFANVNLEPQEILL